MADFGQPISQLVGNELETLRQRIIQNIQAAGAVATGKTIQNIYIERRTDGGALKFRGSMPFGVLETGRRGVRSQTIIGDPRLVSKNPKIPYNFSTIIYNWMQTRGIHGLPMPYKTNRQHKYASAQERADWSMAAAIAHVIHKGSKERPQGGTLLNRMGGRNNIYSNVIPQAVQAITNKIRPFIEVVAVESIKLNIKDLKNQ